MEKVIVLFWKYVSEFDYYIGYNNGNDLEDFIFSFISCIIIFLLMLFMRFLFLISVEYLGLSDKKETIFEVCPECGSYDIHVVGEKKIKKWYIANIKCTNCDHIYNLEGKGKTIVICSFFTYPTY